MSTVPGWRHPPRIRAALAAVWFGTSLGVAALGAPSVFAVLPGPQAGPIVGRMLEREATLGLVLGALLIGLEHLQSRARAEAGLPGPRFSVELLLALGAVFCTVAGHHALLPWMEQARAGRGALSFGQLHAISVAFYAVKMGFVGTLAWRALGALSAGPGRLPPDPRA